MRRNLAVLFLIAVLAFPVGAPAENASVDVGLGYHYFDYKEDIAPPRKSTESGWLPSVYAAYTYKKKSDFYTRVYADYAAGDITFDGTTQAGTPVNFSDSRQRLFKFEWNVGYTFKAGENLLLIPYIGYGYRYWERGKGKITPTYTAYEEDYWWSYLPIGLKADYAVTKQWSIGATAAINVMFDGKMKAKLAEVGVGSDTEFDLGNKVGFYAELPVACKVAPNWAIVGTPWYEYSQIGQSDVVGNLYEPSSRTHQYGLRLGASYSF